MGPVEWLDEVEWLNAVERLDVIPSVVTVTVPVLTSGCPLTSRWGGCETS